MTETPQAHGWWWFPPASDERRQGRLKTGDSPWTLDLTYESEYVSVRPLVDYPESRAKVALGSVDGWPVTVINPRRTGVEIKGVTSVTVTETWSVSGYIDGAHLPDRDAPIDAMDARFGPLVDWALPPMPDMDSDGSSVTITTPAETKLASARLDGALIEVVTNTTLNSSTATRQVGFQQDTSLRVVTVTDTTLTTLVNDWLMRLRDMLAFCTTSHVEILPAAVYFTDAGRSHQGTFHVPWLEPRRPQTVTPLAMLLPLKQLIRHGFEEFVQRWFAVWQSHRRAVTPLLVPTYAPHLYADVDFLLAALAAEGYHQVAFSQTVPNDEHDVRVRRVVESAPEDLKTWVAGALARRNNKSFRRKLDDLLGRAGATGERVVEVLPEFVSRVNAARQVVAHPSSYENRDGTELLYLANALRWVVRHCLLLDLGFDGPTCTSLVAECEGFKRDMILLGHLMFPLEGN